MIEFASVANELGFVEGPVWTGRDLMVTSITQGVIFELGTDGRKPPRVHASPGGGPNGLVRSPNGTLWAAQGGGGHFDMDYVSMEEPGLLCIAVDGSVEYAVSSAVTAPSDCAFGPDGLIYFTDPKTTFDVPEPGQVIAYDTRSGAATKLTSDADYPEGFYPNGIAFGPGGSTLYIADTKNRRVLQYDLADGTLSAPRLFTAYRGFPDGLAVDQQGNVYVAMLTKDVIAVYSPQADLVDTIEIPGSGPTNLCFAGDDLSTMVVTASKTGSVLTASASVPGLPLFGPDGS